MNEPFLLSNLIDLQEIDNEIYKIESQKAEGEDVVNLKKLEIKYKEGSKLLEVAKNKLSDYFTQLEKDELDTKNIKQKIENIDLKLTDKSLDPNELFNYTKQKQSSEKQLSKITNNIEFLQSENTDEVMEIKNAEERIEELKKDLIEVSKKVQQNWKSLDIKLAESESRKKEMILSFPQEFQKLYDDLKARGVEVIAAYKLENSQCGCCGVDLTSSEMHKIKSSKYQQCPYCDGVVV